MAATAQTVITSARYDLKDYQKGIVYDNAELLDYLNRVVGVLDSTLASLGSDLVEAEDTTTFDTSTSNAYVDLSTLNSGNWDSIKSVWIGSDMLTQISVDAMRYKRQYESGTGTPYYWALSNQLLLFEHADSSAQDLEIYYNKKTATLSLTSSMPYNDRFNELIREMLVLHAKAKKEGKLMNTDRYYNEVFRARVMQENLRRTFIKKPYCKDY